MSQRRKFPSYDDPILKLLIIKVKITCATLNVREYPKQNHLFFGGVRSEQNSL